MDVQFEEDRFKRKVLPAQQAPGMTEKLIARGMASDVAGANRLLIALAVVFLALAGGIFFLMNGNDEPLVPEGPRVINEPGSPPRLYTPQ